MDGQTALRHMFHMLTGELAVTHTQHEVGNKGALAQSEKDSSLHFLQVFNFYFQTMSTTGYSELDHYLTDSIVIDFENTTQILVIKDNFYVIFFTTNDR